MIGRRRTPTPAPPGADAELGQCDCGKAVSDGTKDNPYLIYNATHLRAFIEKMIKGSIKRDAHAKLMNDIVLNDGTFDDDGNYTPGESGKNAETWYYFITFSGVFDGNGHTIKGLYILNHWKGALFNALRGGSVKNLVVTGYVSGENMIGGIAANAYDGATVENCVNICRVVITGTNSTGGGVVGSIDGDDSVIKNCANLGHVSFNGNHCRAGGIAGECVNSSKIINCYNAGKITGSGDDKNTFRYVGGIVGTIVSDNITNCYYLEGTASVGVGGYPSISDPVQKKTKAELASTVLELLQNGDESSPWAKNGYVSYAEMTLPLLYWQNADGHTHSYEGKHSSTEHWKECACGVIESGSVAPHSGGEANCLKRATCEICGTEYGSWDPFNHVGTEDWVATDAETHKNVWACCGVSTVSGEPHNWKNGECTKCHYACAHSGGTATCTEQAVCEICGEKYGAVDPDNHTDITEWIQTATKHTQKYKCCGAVTVTEENHEWENGVCTECHYTCAHSGGNATCKDKAVCELCGKEYGELKPHSYSEEWSTDDANHWHECTACGAKTDEAKHIDTNKNHKCDVCEKTLSKCADENGDHNCDLCGKKLSEHSGGTATCKERATCEICGEKYGSLNPDKHADTTEWIQTATTHTQKYKCCGEVVVADESHEWENGVCTECGYDCDHTGGNATCKDKAVCELCGKEYGELKPHSYSEEWSTDDANHWHECTACGAKTDEAKHIDTNKNHKCDVCEKTLSKCADENGDHNCDLCGKKLSEHSGGTATCKDKATCEICGEKYGSLNPDKHADTTEWIQTATTHTQKYKCCGEVVVANESHELENGVCTECGYGCDHTGGNATCKDKAVCELCGEKYGELKPHSYSEEWSTDDANHWHECTACGAKTDEAKHIDANKNHKCDVCEKTLSKCADENGDHNCDLCGKKLSEHSGGTATCKDKATCEICGEKYGEANAKNHADLKHIEAKAATKTAEGNIEYWYCSGCDKYFSDNSGAKEIAKADTVTAKLPDNIEFPQTGDNSNLLLWIILLFISSGAVIGITVIGRNKKRSAK